jgi:hypothetical protein
MTITAGSIAVHYSLTFLTAEKTVTTEISREAWISIWSRIVFYYRRDSQLSRGVNQDCWPRRRHRSADLHVF